MTTIREILIAARAKIERPEAWTRGAAARTGSGKSLPPEKASRGQCWCAAGAAWSIVGCQTDASHTAINCLSELVHEEFNIGVASYNDAPTTTHADILALFDRAIAATET